MTTLAKLKKVAATFGATVVDEKSGNCHCCRVEAPAGHIWACDFIHELVDETNKPWKPDYADMIDRMTFGAGVLLCPARPDCEWCDSEES
jgi:hypothetical protein